MPRSKRKAVAARAQAKNSDFARKKTKLGKRAQSDTLVDASAVRSRKIYVPPQVKGEASGRNGNTGRNGKSAGAARVSLAELVVRARHYNTHARATALTAMARIFMDEDDATYYRDNMREISAASIAAQVTDAAPVLRVGLEALQDEEAGVRIAANSVVLSVLRRLPSVRPFAQMVAAQLCAALSHIRADVRVAGARAVCSIFQLNTFHAAEIFTQDSVNPLPLLTALLADLTTHKARTATAGAIAALSSWSRAQDVANLSPGNDKVAGDGSVYASNLPFYYHSDPLCCTASATADPFATLPLLMLSADAAGAVVTGVTNLVAEYLPVHLATGDSGQKTALVAASRALSTVVCEHSLQSERVELSVDRILKAWSDEQVDGPSPTMSALAVDVSMAEVALVCGAWDVVGRFLESRLVSEDGVGRVYSGAEGEILDELAERVMRGSPQQDVRKSVMTAWLVRWKWVSEDVSRVGGCVGILRYVMLSRLDEARDAGSEKNSAAMLRVIAQLPSIVAKLMAIRQRRRLQRQEITLSKESSDGGNWDDDEEEDCEEDAEKDANDGVTGLIASLCEICRTYGASGGICGVGIRRVGKELAEHVMKCDVIGNMTDDEVQALVSSLFFCGSGLCTAVVEVLARCGADENASLVSHGITIAWSIEACIALNHQSEAVSGSEQRDVERKLGVLAGALTCGLGALRRRDVGAAAPLLAAVARVVRACGVDVLSVDAVLAGAGANEDEMIDLRHRFFDGTKSVVAMLES
jgi:hypothetical protein